MYLNNYFNTFLIISKNTYDFIFVTQPFDSDVELHVNQWLRSHAADFFKVGIKKLVLR